MRKAVPLFICHANCCRSVLAKYLYEHLNPGCRAESAGMEVGDQINDRAFAMLQNWGIDAGEHCPRRLTRELCGRADAIFLMAPEYLRRLLMEFGSEFANKSYLFADPFSVPFSFQHGEYFVHDPSFDSRPASELVAEFQWFRERVIQIHEALNGAGRPFIPATSYLNLLA